MLPICTQRCVMHRLLPQPVAGYYGPPGSSGTACPAGSFCPFPTTDAQVLPVHSLSCFLSLPPQPPPFARLLNRQLPVLYSPQTRPSQACPPNSNSPPVSDDPTDCLVIRLCKSKHLRKFPHRTSFLKLEIHKLLISDAADVAWRHARRPYRMPKAIPVSGDRQATATVTAMYWRANTRAKSPFSLVWSFTSDFTSPSTAPPLSYFIINIHMHHLPCINTSICTPAQARAGFYGPAGQPAAPCPAGSYCPSQSVDPTRCPANTTSAGAFVPQSCACVCIVCTLAVKCCSKLSKWV